MALFKDYFPPDPSGYKSDRERFQEGISLLIEKIHEQDERIKNLEDYCLKLAGATERPPLGQF